MKSVLTYYQLTKLKESLIANFGKVKIMAAEHSGDLPVVLDANIELLEAFLSSKRIEGCSNRTITYYKAVITGVLARIRIPIREISTDDIRSYLAKYKDEAGCSGTTIDNVRRILSSFFLGLRMKITLLKARFAEFTQ